MKRGLSLLLTLALCLSLCPVSALALDLGGAAAVGSEAAAETPVIVEPAVEAPVAEEAAEEAAADGTTSSSGICGANLSWSIESLTLTISGTGKMYNYGAYDSPWGSGGYGDPMICFIVIEPGVTTIGDYAFYSLDNLFEVTIPSTVTSIGEEAFSHCEYLRTIDLPSGLTKLGENAFYDCISLESITIPDSMTSISSYTFYGCRNLESIHIPSSIREIGWFAFNNCSYLSDVYYDGSQTQWAAIDIKSAGNDNLLNANIHFVLKRISAPVITVSNRASDNKPQLSWGAINGAESYEVWRATSENDTYYLQDSTENNSYVDTDAEAGETYFYKVMAISSDPTLNSDFSNIVSITSNYAQPVVSVKCNATTGKPRLSWSAVDGATKYEIWRATSRNGEYSKIYTTSNCYFNNTTAVANKSYYYKVRAIGPSSDAASDYSSMVSITCDCAKPSVRISCKASTGKPRLTWSAVDGAVKYEVWRAYSKYGTYYKMGTTTGTSYTNTGAKANTTYYYKVYAIGSSSYAKSAASTIVNMTCDCAQPQISVAIRSDGKPRLTWEAVDGAVKYEVWRSGYRNGTYTKLGTTTGTSYSNTGAKAGYTYFYKVRAIGSSSYATSAFSTILSAKCK